MGIHDKIIRLLKEQGLTQVALSRRAGLRDWYVNSMLQNNSTPSATTALQLARALSVPVEWLIDDRLGWPPPAITALSQADPDSTNELEILHR